MTDASYPPARNSSMSEISAANGFTDERAPKLRDFEPPVLCAPAQRPQINQHLPGLREARIRIHRRRHLNYLEAQFCWPHPERSACIEAQLSKGDAQMRIESPLSAKQLNDLLARLLSPFSPCGRAYRSEIERIFLEEPWRKDQISVGRIAL